MECKNSKRNVRRLLRISRKSLRKEDQHKFVVARREYKNLLKRKKKEYNDAMLDKLKTSVTDQREFWSTVNKISFKRKQQRNNITIDRWFQHFKSLLEMDISDEICDEDVNDDECNVYMNRPISREEVLLRKFFGLLRLR